MSFTTRFNLLSDIRKQDDSAWEQFYRIYASLIRLHGKDCGIKDENLEDLVQDVMLSFTAKVNHFQYDPERGRFRDYLRKIIHARAVDMLRDIYKQERMLPDNEEEAVYLDDQFDSEWREHIRHNSLERLKEEVKPHHYQIFYLLDIQNRKIREVADLYHLPEATVYSIRNRTEEKLRNIAKSLDL